MMGTAFRAPKIDDLEQWKKAEMLVKNGFLFERGYGRRPRRLVEVPNFIASLTKKSVGQRILERSQEVSQPSRSRNQARLQMLKTEGKYHLTLKLLGRELKSWDSLEVVYEGRWELGDLRLGHHDPYINLQNGKRVYITSNLVVRFPET